MRHQELRSIHGTDVKVSRLGLGTAPLSGLFKNVPVSESDEILHQALSTGISYIDTAPLYGYGVGETRVGRGIKGFTPAPTISTKVGRLLRPGKNSELDKWPDSDPNIEIYFDHSPSGIRRSLEESLARLGRESIEIAYIHDADNWVREAVDVVYPELHAMREEGIIKAIGIGMNQCEVPTRVMKATDLDMVLIAGRYSLLDQSALKELLPTALDRKVDVIAAGVFNSGILANPVKGATFDYMPASDQLIAKAVKIRDVLQGHQVSLTSAALQFPLRHPAVKSVLVGCRTPAEVSMNIKEFNHVMENKVWDDLVSVL
jgi:D-threo-aldose 1-dehydrogenase